MTAKIKIPDEYYTCLKHLNKQIAAAFLTPYGTDKSSIKRIQNITSITNAYSDFEPVIIKNIPLYGFKFSGNLRRSGQYGSGDKWYIEDPRGFSVEISSSNLSYIIQHNIIENGTILDSCIWGRQGGNNVLLATSTELYKDAVIYSNLNKTSESIKNVNIGNIIALQNGIEGVYLGKYRLLRIYGGRDKTIEWSNQHHLINEINAKTNISQLHTYTTLKVSRIIDKNSIDSKEAEQLVNNIIIEKTQPINSQYPILAAVAKTPKSFSINLVLCDDIDDILNNNNNDSTYIVELVSGEFGVYTNFNDHRANIIDVTQLSTGYLRYALTNSHPFKPISKKIKSGDIKAFYKIEIDIKSKLGYEIKTYF